MLVFIVAQLYMCILWRPCVTGVGRPSNCFDMM